MLENTEVASRITEILIHDMQSADAGGLSSTGVCEDQSQTATVELRIFDGFSPSGRFIVARDSQ